MELFKEIQELGQSIWYDNISRELLQNGHIEALIKAGEIKGITSNPSIFEKAIATGDVYDAAVAEQCKIEANIDDEKLFEHLAIADIQAAADLLRPIYDATKAQDGYVSLEVSPRLAHDAAGTFQAARSLHAAVDRPNLMIKVPATDEGFPVVTDLIDAGISVNVTLLFSHQDWRRSAEAYVEGVRRRHQRGEELSQVASVASFFVSRLDAAVDKVLADDSPLGGKIAVAYSKQAYQQYRDFFAGADFVDLQKHGAQLQRLLWASTGTKNAAYSDLLYVEQLFGADTVNTMPPKTLDALRDHGRAEALLEKNADQAHQYLNAAAAAGVDLELITRELKTAGVASFMKSYDGLLAALRAKRANL